MSSTTDRRKFLRQGGIITSLVGAGVLTGASPAFAAAESQSRRRASLVGTWSVTISTPEHPEWTPEFHGLIAFLSDGITISSDAADITIGIGSWSYGRARDSFSLLRRSNFVDDAGAVLNVLHTTHHGTFDEKSFRAVGFGKMYKADGTLDYDIPGVLIVGERF